MRVGGIDIEVLARPARLLHVVLHAAQHGGDDFPRPRTDLERALALEPSDRWEEAASLADRLGAMPAFTTGLHLTPKGAHQAEQLDLGAPADGLVALQAQGAPPFVVNLERLFRMRGVLRRFRFIARRAIPPAEYMRWLYPRLTKHGAIGLVLAYAWRPVSIASRLPVAIVAWRRLRAKDRGLRQADGSAGRLKN
jgi:hypothetical protein